RHEVLDQNGRVAMLAVAQEKGARDVGLRTLAGELCIDLITGECGAKRDLERIIASVGAKLHQPSGQVDSIAPLPLQLDVVDGRLVMEPDPGDAVALQAAIAEAAIAFQHHSRAPRLGNDDVARHSRAGLALAVELDEMNWLIEGDMAADA